MTLGYASKLGLKIRFINIKALKIENSIFKTFKIALASFQIEDKLKRSSFFRKCSYWQILV